MNDANTENDFDIVKTLKPKIIPLELKDSIDLELEESNIVEQLPNECITNKSEKDVKSLDHINIILNFFKHWRFIHKRIRDVIEMNPEFTIPISKDIQFLIKGRTMVSKLLVNKVYKLLYFWDFITDCDIQFIDNQFKAKSYDYKNIKIKFWTNQKELRDTNSIYFVSLKTFIQTIQQKIGCSCCCIS